MKRKEKGRRGKRDTQGEVPDAKTLLSHVNTAAPHWPRSHMRCFAQVVTRNFEDRAHSLVYKSQICSLISRLQPTVLLDTPFQPQS